MKIDTGTITNAIGCHHWRVTNSSGSPTALRQASTAARSPRSPLSQSLTGPELRLIFLTPARNATIDRKSTRLNSSHLVISYAVFCLKKKKNKQKSSHSLYLQPT